MMIRRNAVKTKLIANFLADAVVVVGYEPSDTASFDSKSRRRKVFYDRQHRTHTKTSLSFYR